MVKKTAQSITLRTEDETQFVHVVFMDGSSLDLKGPRSGLRHKERDDGNRTVYDCEFEGFELA